MSVTMDRAVHSFAPVSGANARVLILGSMPGVRSLEAGEYYAHPRNYFWAFMGELVGAGRQLPYHARCERLVACGIALWDVLESCEREGSLDAAIRHGTSGANDFATFLRAHPGIRTVLLNGKTAARVFEKVVVPNLGRADIAYRGLPSTSPANAAQHRDYKLAQWRDALQAAGVTVAAHA